MKNFQAIIAADVRKSARLDKLGRRGSGYTMRHLLVFYCCLFFCVPRMAEGASLLGDAAVEDAVNLYCLSRTYPLVRALERDEGREWLVLADGRRVLYGRVSGAGFESGFEPDFDKSREMGLEPEFRKNSKPDPWSVDVRRSMADIYPLEPHRPATPEGVAPGRRRSYSLLEALYGANPRQVGEGLRTAQVLGQPVRLAEAAADALQRVDALLEESVRQRPELRLLLISNGGFCWRRIAGEQRLSPHAFGVALDLSADRAPYWRWSRLRPHPMQQSYPSEIVTAFESQGFIWGGKWHEYDLMHFEYRPEKICKARVLQTAKKLNRQFADR